MGGGGNSSGSQEFKPPAYAQQGWKDYLSGAQNLASQPLNPYMGQTVSPLTPMTGAGLQQLSDFSIYGTPVSRAGSSAITNAATGGAQNEFIGQNPYMMSLIDASNSKLLDQYKRAVQSPNDAMMARAGAFGGSEWEDRTRHNEQDLAGATAANTNNLLSQNYTQSAALREADLNRRLQGAQVGQGQQSADLQAIMSMIAGGQLPQQNYQQLLDANRGIYQQQQQAPFTLSDFLGGALQRASGGQGSQTYTTPGQSPLANIAGLGLLGAGMFG